MTRFTVTTDDRRELDRARAVLSKAYDIHKEKRPQTSESQRYRAYLYALPKDNNPPENGPEQAKNGRSKFGKNL